jgi:hypothetical protein
VLSDAQAQSLQDRISAVREQRERQALQQEAQPQPESQQIPRKMGILFDEVFFDQTPAREVFQWWSATTEIPLVIDWNGMEIDGVDPEQGITLNLQTVPAKLLLNVIMQQASPDADLIYEVTPWYVHVMTKRQANRNPVLRVYDVTDMVMTIPNFTNAPRFDLNEALSNTSSGGSGGGGGGGSSDSLFGDSEDNEEEEPTKNERGQNIADMIRQTIEPDIWASNGGVYASARYYDGKLIVNAPMYVHRQIGIPVVAAYRPGAAGGYVSPAGGTQAPSSHEPFGVQDR